MSDTAQKIDAAKNTACRLGLTIRRYQDPCEPETLPLGMCAVLTPDEKNRDDFWYVQKGWYGNLPYLVDEAIERMNKQKSATVWARFRDLFRRVSKTDEA